MSIRCIRSLVWVLGMVTSFTILFAEDKEPIAQKEKEIAMRSIGDRLLRCAGDHSSRVLPIEYSEDQYFISFETPLSFDPEDLIIIAEEVINETNIATKFLVEVQQSDSKEAVHGFVIDRTNASNTAACQGRILPTDHYRIMVALLDEQNDRAESQSPFPTSLIWVLPILVLIGFVNYYRKKTGISDANARSATIQIGDTRFVPQLRALQFGQKQIQLSVKESDLLEILSDSINQTIAREILLNKVWGDEGDYIGRTLDVFISKLRKKLEPDSSIQIVNERGVGYKLVCQPAEQMT